jgi:hypothetical protein
MSNWYANERPGHPVPPTMVRGFRLEIRDEQGPWRPAAEVADNYQRLVRVDLGVRADAIRLIPEQTWGREQAHVFAFEVR